MKPLDDESSGFFFVKSPFNSCKIKA